MKRFFVALLFVCISAAAHSQHQLDPLATEKISCSEMHAFRMDELDPNFKLAPTQDYDLNYLDIDWQLDFVTGGIAGNITYYFTTANDIDTFFLDCSDLLMIDAAFHQGVPLFAIQDSNILKVVLDQTIIAGTFDSVTIQYHGLPQPGGLGGYMFSGHNGDSIIATLSQPYSSRSWWPSKMTLDDKIDSTKISVTVPLDYRVGSNGLLKKIDTLTSSTEVVYQWVSNYPIATYLIGIAAYPYEELTHEVVLNDDTLFLQHYVYSDSYQIVEDYTLTLDSTLQLFTDLFGTYPFIKEKYGHAQWNRGGGMEHQTMSFVSDFNHNLIAHELAHQWFGDKITCASWSDIWLNEGWATYATALTFEKLFGGYWWKIAIKATNERALQDSTESVYCTDTTDISRIFSSRLSYSKGACVLHSLRYMLGDEDFFVAVKDYITDTSLAYDFSRTINFKQHLEEPYGSSLDEFFNDWYYGKGNPDLELLWTQRDYQVVCKLVQTSYAHPNDGFVFDMKVPVKFYGNGIDTTIDLVNDNEFNTYSFSIPFAVDSVSIDPDLWWLIGHKKVQRLDYLFEEGSIHVFPNPFSDNLDVVSSDFHESITGLEIFGVDGKQLLSTNSFQSEPFEPIHIILTNLASGSYYLRVATTLSSYTIPVIKLP